MKKLILKTTMIMLLSSTCISTFANNFDYIPSTSEPRGPIRRAPHMPYIIDRMDLRINYDNHTLDSIPEILEKIKDLDRKKVFVHFERVWQTENESTEQSRILLRTIIKKFIKAGFCVNQGTFRGYPYSCPSDMKNSIVINYDGSIHKCNGRTLSQLTKYGVLKNDGSLDIDENLLAKRLSVATFENKECLSCKMLPVCMGPCSQKILEHNGEWSKSICSLISIDTSLSDYLVTDFWVKFKVEKYNG